MAEQVTPEKQAPKRGVSPVRLLLKALALFVIFNVLYLVVQPMSLLNRITVYNVLVPGRLRLPFAEFPEDSYNISIVNLDQMLASHAIARPKAADEYRVVMIGDSAVWGYLLKPTETQAGCLDSFGLTLPSGRKVRVYNLGYPKLTVMKDLLILRHALQYQPDLVIWPVTLASLYPSDQLQPAVFPIITDNYDEVVELIKQYHFKLYELMPAPAWFAPTFFGQRRELANWLRYQLYGLDWAATGIDHVVSRFVASHPTTLIPDDNILSVNMMHLSLAPQKKFVPSDLSFDIVQAGIQIAESQGVPVLLVNEPMYRDETNPLRWNTYYPRWAYDSYREALRDTATQQGWHYVDFWDAMPSDQFTDTDFHLSPAASCAYARKLQEPMLALATAPR
jgi:hypothetical protein